jgi:hypothetical protein
VNPAIRSPEHPANIEKSKGGNLDEDETNNNGSGRRNGS